MRILFAFLFHFIFIVTTAQTPESDIAKTFMRQGDYSNAILVLTNAHEQNPGDLATAKDLALCYYFQKDNVKGIAIMKPFLDGPNADDQCYQITCNMLLANEQKKDAEKLYKKGLKKFPKSGPLYNDLGELLWVKQNYAAIQLWEKGIQQDPSYPKNYYNAARYYYLSTEKVWGLIYGEIFVNLEPNTQRSSEIKEILIESYKKLFTDSKLQEIKTKNEFANAYLNTMQQQSAIAAQGIHTESLIMIRTRFILNWADIYAAKFPFRLFEFHKQLLQEGLFEAYNHWLFTSTGNLSAYQNWINMHLTEYNNFDRIQKGRIFRVPSNQYYNN